MIKFENTEVLGWEHAIRGMRNPMNSWEKSDSGWDAHIPPLELRNEIDWDEYAKHYIPVQYGDEYDYDLGPNDRDLMMRLRNAGTDHRKFMRMIAVYVDITGPLYWWKEFDTYKVGTVANSCSTMHKIADKEFTIEDFSCEHLTHAARIDLGHTIDALNFFRGIYLHGGMVKNEDGNLCGYGAKSKQIWWQMIQLLPSSYNQKRTVMMNYEVLANIYKSRKDHKLDEWSETKLVGDHPSNMYPNKFTNGFCDWIKTLPYSELITGEFIKEEK